MQVWATSTEVHCAGITVGLNELTARLNPRGLIDIVYATQPNFFAYRNTKFQKFREKDGMIIGVDAITMVTRLNEIFQVGNTAQDPATNGGVVFEERRSLTIVAPQSPLLSLGSAYRWADVRYIYRGENSSQYGGFSVTEKGIEDHTFWGVSVELFEVLFNLGAGQVSVRDVNGYSGSFSCSITRRIPVFNG